MRKIGNYLYFIFVYEIKYIYLFLYYIDIRYKRRRLTKKFFYRLQITSNSLNTKEKMISLYYYKEFI